jgi:hypothetical protein
MNNPRRLRFTGPLGSLVLTGWLGLLGGCHSLHLDTPPLEGAATEAKPAIPQKKSFRVSQYVFYADFNIDRRLPLFKELASLRDQVHKELQLPAANTVVQVYVFENRDRYQRFMKSKYPELPERRAFFVAQPRGVRTTEDLLVYTYWGDRIQEDLRHELTHALLHSVLKDVPLWLDEGLAEYFELAPGWKGINFQHLDFLCADAGEAFRPDLARLEQLTQVDQMRPAEYRESWAWVHFMLHHNLEAKKALVKYLQELRTNSNPGPLRPRLAAAIPTLDGALQNHLARLDGSARPVSVPRR